MSMFVWTSDRDDQDTTRRTKQNTTRTYVHDDMLTHILHSYFAFCINIEALMKKNKYSWSFPSLFPLATSLVYTNKMHISLPLRVETNLNMSRCTAPGPKDLSVICP